MICSEVREYIFAFLDNELDVPQSIELQHHLDHCPDCAREAEIERTIRKRLEIALESGDDSIPDFTEALPPEFDRQRYAAMFRKQHRRSALKHRRLIMKAAAVLVIAVGSWMILYEKDQVDNPRFSDLVVADFEHFVEENKPLQLVSAESTQVAAWLLEETAIEVNLPDPSGSDWRLVGARRCKIDGRKAAFVIYESKAGLASLVALHGTSDTLRGLQKIEHENQMHWVDRCRGYTVTACQRGDLVYAVVSQLPEDALISLMRASD